MDWRTVIGQVLDCVGELYAMRKKSPRTNSTFGFCRHTGKRWKNQKSCFFSQRSTEIETKLNKQKKDLSESDIKAKFITPAILKAGWDEQTQLGREIFFTNGRIYVKGKLTARGKQKFADYILLYKPNVPIAVIEAKDNKHSVKSGIQQSLGYGNTLDIPFVFSSNGDGFYFHDKTATDRQIEKELSLDEFPSPQELWEKYKKYKGIESKEVEKIISQDYFQDAL